MLEYCVRYRAAIDRITQKRDLGLRDFELTDEEWKLAKQLRDSLKVCLLVVRMTSALTLSLSLDPPLSPYLSCYRHTSPTHAVIGFQLAAALAPP